MFGIRDLFELGMKRDIGELNAPHGVQINLGGGNSVMPNVTNLDFPEWDADESPIPYSDATIDVIHAYHFFEHVKYPIAVLFECQRVLKYGGSLNIVVPYYNSNMQSDNLEHYHAFNENTWRRTFEKGYYDKKEIKWEFDINVNVIIGIEERCLALMTQLVRR